MKKLKLKKRQYKGKLIVFEGTDGAGKTTLIELTKAYLESRICQGKIICLKQPTDLSRKTRLFQKMMFSDNHDDINYRAVQLLTMSDRVQHGFEVIEPLLKEGNIVICDRYVFTSLANMIARNYRKEKWFYDVAKNILKPNLVFLAYIKPNKAIQRIRLRPAEKDRFLDEKLLHRVSNEFLRMSSRESFFVINTDKNPEESFEQVKKIIDKEILK